MKGWGVTLEAKHVKIRWTGAETKGVLVINTRNNEVISSHKGTINVTFFNSILSPLS